MPAVCIGRGFHSGAPGLKARDFPLYAVPASDGLPNYHGALMDSTSPAAAGVRWQFGRCPQAWL